MTKLTIGTLFAGFGGVDIGAMAAGLTPLWAVEYDAAIAGVYRQNIGDHVTVADILALDPLDFEPVDVLHASPPCPNFSVAKAGAEETETDIALGRKVAAFVRVLRPTCFTLENVYGYRKAKSFRIIVKALAKAGYQYRWWHLNAADFGVPQTRKRLILVARLDGVPQRPTATHAPAADLAPLFDIRQPWVGWYAAIEDLIPSLPDSEFAPWQLARLPAGLKGSVFMDCNTTGFERSEIGKGVRDCASPTGTIPAQVAGGLPRAFIVSNAATEWSDGQRDGDDPALAVSLQTGGQVRACVTGRVVQMTPRALARFQSIPDWYALPESRVLSAKGIGNAVPPLLYQRVIEAQLS